MRILDLSVIAAVAGTALAAPSAKGTGLTTTTKTTKKATKFQFVGVNQSGPEFGNNVLPGTLGKEYTWPSKSAIDVGVALVPPGKGTANSW